MFIAKALVFGLIFAFLNAQQNSPIGTSLNNFSNRFYKTVTNIKTDQNVICSGFSADVILALLSIGARGATQKELTTALELPNQANIDTAYKTMMININSVTGVTLSTANKVYVQEFPGLDLEPDFKQKAINSFFAETEKINFSNSDQAISTINAWIEKKTNNKIINALKPGSITSDTRVVLANCIYFKGLWEIQFNETLTMAENFNVNLNKKVQIDMMQRLGIFGVLEKNDWEATIIELPYIKEKASMVIILPTKIDGLAEVEKKVSVSNLKQDIFDGISKRKIFFKMPRFKIETEIDLKLALPKLGINLIFQSGAADLSGLLNNKQSLFVSTAVQKAFIEVNEKGTEATAATVIGSSTTSAPPELFCDRPFMFFVKLATGEVLFTGRFTGNDSSAGTNQPGSGLTLGELRKLRNQCRRYPHNERPKFCEQFYPITVKSSIPIKRIKPSLPPIPYTPPTPVKFEILKSPSPYCSNP